MKARRSCVSEMSDYAEPGSVKGLEVLTVCWKTLRFFATVSDLLLRTPTFFLRRIASAYRDRALNQQSSGGGALEAGQTQEEVDLEQR